jgi:hypothetical protein
MFYPDHPVIIKEGAELKILAACIQGTDCKQFEMNPQGIRTECCELAGSIIQVLNPTKSDHFGAKDSLSDRSLRIRMLYPV